MTSLLDRLRAATSPDRDLDAEVARACGWIEIYTLDGEQRGRASDGQWAEVPRFTGSVDDALTLVPDGAEVQVRRFRSGRAIAAVGQGDGQEAVTPALALAVAALSARGVV